MQAFMACLFSNNSKYLVKFELLEVVLVATRVKRMCNLYGAPPLHPGLYIGK